MEFNLKKLKIKVQSITITNRTIVIKEIKFKQENLSQI